MHLLYSYFFSITFFLYSLRWIRFELHKYRFIYFFCSFSIFLLFSFDFFADYFFFYFSLDFCLFPPLVFLPRSAKIIIHFFSIFFILWYLFSFRFPFLLFCQLFYIFLFTFVPLLSFISPFIIYSPIFHILLFFFSLSFASLSSSVFLRLPVFCNIPVFYAPRGSYARFRHSHN